MNITINTSTNCSKKPRNSGVIKFVIIHYTGMQSEIESIARLKDKKFKVSCHYLINRKGQVFQMVNDNFTAWHAGKSKWKKFTNLNENSIGIELVNKGHKFGYQAYTKVQIKSLIDLCKYLKKKYKISNANFLGHSDIAPLRKIDPGEKFPWKHLSRHNIGNWYSDKKKELVINENAFFYNLYKIGYRYFDISKRSLKDKMIIKSFQRRYVPNNVTGRIDKKTYKISHYLASKSK